MSSVYFIKDVGQEYTLVEFYMKILDNSRNTLKILRNTLSCSCRILSITSKLVVKVVDWIWFTSSGFTFAILQSSGDLNKTIDKLINSTFNSEIYQLIICIPAAFVILISLKFFKTLSWSVSTKSNLNLYLNFNNNGSRNPKISFWREILGEQQDFIKLCHE